jgi:hypothetical protein
MADAPRGGAAPTAGGFASRGGERRGDRGRGRRGPRRGANKDGEKEWQPVTKLGRLVKAGKIKSMEEIYLHSLSIKEYQIVDFFMPTLKDEVMNVCLVRLRLYNSQEHQTDFFRRSNLCRSRLVPVNVPVSRPSSSSGTRLATLVLESRPRKKSRRPSVLPS